MARQARPRAGRGALRRRLARFAARRFPRTALRLLRPGGDDLGAAGEALAARHLRSLGWRILGRRLATPAAEVDLVALDGDVLVVVEVKTGRLARIRIPRGARGDLALASLRWRPRDRCSPRQERRLGRAARWLAERSGARRTRVDLVEVCVDARGRARVTRVAGAVRSA